VFFLGFFFLIEKEKFKGIKVCLHLDIAGPAFVEHTWGENPSGASGVGVRSITRFIENLIRDIDYHFFNKLKASVNPLRILLNYLLKTLF